MPSILIADDNEGLRKVLAWLLQPRGYETLQAATGREAIEKAIAAQPGLILLDIRLPDMNGADVARAIKTNSRTAHIPIVGWSAYLESIGAKKHGEQEWSLIWKSHFQCQ
jgi:CheY-like chemotaxis protein